MLSEEQGEGRDEIERRKGSAHHDSTYGSEDENGRHSSTKIFTIQKIPLAVPACDNQVLAILAYITNILRTYHTVFDLFFVQIFHETFRQLRNESPLKFLIRDKTSTMKTRSNSKGLLILPALSPNLNVMTEVGFKSFFKKISRLYIIDNESMFSLFYHR